jgi:hypothetical protein
MEEELKYEFRVIDKKFNELYTLTVSVNERLISQDVIKVDNTLYRLRHHAGNRCVIVQEVHLIEGVTCL